MGKAFRIGVIAGVPVRVHVSLLVVLPLLALLFGNSFARAARVAHVPPDQLWGPHWLWGLGIAVGLFVAVLLHELAHTLYALRSGGAVRDITLFFMGGVSSVSKPPRGARHEALMSAVGPAVSLAIGGLLLLLARKLDGVPSFNLRFAVFYLGTLNLFVGAFNLLPAFPLDGGRILRAVLTNPLGQVRATSVAAAVGKVLAVVLGLLGLLSWNFLLAAIALFVFMGAEAEKRQALMSEVLGPVRVSELLVAAPEPIDSRASVEEAVERMRRDGVLVLPVASGATIRGLVTVDALRDVSEESSRTRVGQVARPIEPLPPTASAAEAIERMGELELSELPVVDAGHLAGMVSQERINRWLAVRSLREGSRLRALHHRHGES